MKVPLSLGILTVAALGLVCQSRAATITLDVNADTYLRENQTTTAKDGDNQLLVGSVGGTALRPLLRFDTTPLDNLGPTIQVNSVTLTVTNTGTNGSGGVQTISVYQYGFDFVESAATWNNPDGATGGDETAGGTFNTSTTLASLSGHSVNANSAATFTSSSAFTTLVQNALSGDNAINLILQGAVENSGNNYYRFRDSEGFSSGFFQMTVDYTVIPEPRAALLGGLGLLALLRRRR